MVWASSFTVMLVGATGTFVLLLVGLPYQRVHVWWTAPVFAFVTKCATMKLQIHYHPDFDPEQRSVFAQNHINLLDGHVASATIPHAFSGLMNAWQFKIPIYGWLMSMSKGIPVNKTRRDKLIETLATEARKRKEIGMSVLTFPEGHRTTTGKVRSFKRGVFLMAHKADMPVVPIAVRGMYEANNKTTGWLFSPFRTIDVFVGPQFDSSRYPADDIGQLADDVQRWIVDALESGEFPQSPAQDTSEAAQ